MSSCTSPTTTIQTAASDSCSRRRAAATSTPSPACSSPTAASCTRTATGCSARSTTPRTRCRTPSLRAWRALPRFEGRSSLRSWLYTIATNTCLNQIQRRPKRVLPIDYGPATDPHVGPGRAADRVGLGRALSRRPSSASDGLAGPDARYELRESVELAFIVALQHLPATQRAVLILREVLGFSAKEVAETLDTTVASVNSALQRARASIEERAPRAEPAGDAARARRRGAARARRDLRRRLGAQRRRRRRLDARRGRDDLDAAARELVRAARRDRRRSCELPDVRRVALARRAHDAPTASPRSASTPGTRTRRRTCRSRSTC